MSTVTIDLSTSEGISQFSIGATHEHYSIDEWDDATAIVSAKQLLQSSVIFQNQHIMGWGATNPDRHLASMTGVILTAEFS